MFDINFFFHITLIYGMVMYLSFCSAHLRSVYTLVAAVTQLLPASRSKLGSNQIWDI